MKPGPQDRSNTSPAHIETGARRRPVQSRAQTTVAAILEAASQLLREGGYDRISTNLIARRAGVSVGSLYQYFASKEAIYAAIIADHIAEMRATGEHAMQVMADPDTDFATAQRRVLTDFVAAHAPNDDLMRALERELIQVFPEWRGSHEDDEAFVAQIAQILAARADCHPADPVVAARIVFTVWQGIVKWLVHAAPPGTDPEPYIEQVIAVCCLAAAADA